MRLKKAAIYMFTTFLLCLVLIYLKNKQNRWIENSVEQNDIQTANFNS